MVYLLNDDWLARRNAQWLSCLATETRITQHRSQNRIQLVGIFTSGDVSIILATLAIFPGNNLRNMGGGCEGSNCKFLWLFLVQLDRFHGMNFRYDSLGMGWEFKMNHSIAWYTFWGEGPSTFFFSFSNFLVREKKKLKSRQTKLLNFKTRKTMSMRTIGSRNGTRCRWTVKSIRANSSRRRRSTLMMTNTTTRAI